MTTLVYIGYFPGKERLNMLNLYYSPTCPYCRKVIDFFNANGIDFTLKDVSDTKNYDDLMSFGKIAQVPFLVDTSNHKSMYESDSIIDYVKNLKL